MLLGFAILFIYFGYYIMAKLDDFIAAGGIVSDDEIYPVAIVLGGTELAKQVSALLEKNNIHVLYLTEPFLIEQGHNFQYLFALSESDADNIVLCKIGFKVYGIEKMISFCNDSRNEGIFIREKIPHLTGKEITAQRLYEAVLQKREEKLWENI